MKRKSAASALVLGVVWINASVAIAPATVVCVQASASGCGARLEPRFFEVRVKPSKLPRKEMAPAGVSINGAIAMSDGTRPPALSQMTIEFDRNGAVDATGLPTCSRRTLETLDESDIRRLCREAIVGTGLAHVAIDSPEPIRAPLSLFNGGVRDGITTMFIRLLVRGPVPAAALATVKLRKIHQKGPYAQAAVVSFPEIAEGRGALLDFALTIKRLFAYKGKKLSYVTARCLDGEQNTDVVSRFVDGSRLSVSFIQPCTPKS